MNTIKIKEPFVLENNSILEELTFSFSTYGSINKTGDNVVWVSHALTANSDVFDWWKGLFGIGKCFDPRQYFIVCPNILGSCYGSTGPASPSESKKPLLNNFPEITTRDMARFQDKLRELLDIKRIHVLIGPSLGGQQALEWSILKPDIIDHLILVATNAKHSPYGIALNETQRWAIQSDPTYGDGNVQSAKEGLAIARSVAMISYRCYSGYAHSQSESHNEARSGFRASSYQRYQGRKLAGRFNAYAYLTLTGAMDSHNVGRGRPSVEVALNQVEARTLCIGIESDNLFPISEQEFIADHIPDSEFISINSEYGHDGFLIETEQLSSIISEFIENEFKRFRYTKFRERAVDQINI